MRNTLIAAGELLGVDLRRMKDALLAAPHFAHDAVKYMRQRPPADFLVEMRSLYPVFSDRRKKAGTVSGDYFHQDLWAARRVYRRRPQRHLDIGSLIESFVAHLLVFMEVDVIDIRVLESQTAGLHFHREDATRLSSIETCSIESLSSLHVAEHFGLGRYSDPIDPQAHLTFMSTLERVLRPGGYLYFSVPIGRQRLRFNAHRVFDPATVIRAFGGLRLCSFSFVDAGGNLHEDASPSDFKAETRDGCGLFEFTK